MKFWIAVQRKVLVSFRFATISGTAEKMRLSNNEKLGSLFAIL